MVLGPGNRNIGLHARVRDAVIEELAERLECMGKCIAREHHVEESLSFTG